MCVHIDTGGLKKEDRQARETWKIEGYHKNIKVLASRARYIYSKPQTMLLLYILCRGEGYLAITRTLIQVQIRFMT